MLRRSRQRAPNLRVGDRLLCGFGALFLSPGRIRKVAIGTAPVHVADLPSGAGARQVPPIVFLKRATERSRAQRGRASRSSAPSSSSNRAILDSGARGLRASSRRRSGSTSTRTSCTACWRNALVPPRAEPGPRGCRSSDTRQTVCGAWTSCAVRPSCSRATGCSWSWTSSRGASWDAVCIADRSMHPASAACATAAIHGRGAAATSQYGS